MRTPETLRGRGSRPTATDAVSTPFLPARGGPPRAAGHDICHRHPTGDPADRAGAGAVEPHRPRRRTGTVGSNGTAIFVSHDPATR